MKIKLRGGTAAEWTSANPILAAREVGVETDTGKMKVGDGSTAWTSLGYSTMASRGGDLAVTDGGTGASTAAGARTNLGLGSIATQAASSVAITGGSITGITDVAVADGGTGASTAAAARTNLAISGVRQLPAATPVRTGDLTLSANVGYGRPVNVDMPIRVRRARLRVSGQTGAVDVGVYNSALSRQTYSGGAQVTPAGPMEVALRPVELSAGQASIWVAPSAGSGFAASGTQGDLEDAMTVSSGMYPLPSTITGVAQTATSVAVTVLPDDPTPLSVAYAREQIGYSVLGKIGTRLYGRNISTDAFAYSDDDGINWTDSVTTMASVFGVGASVVEIIGYTTYMFAMTLNPMKLWRANLDAFSTWAEKTPGDLPSGTLGRVGTIATYSGGTPRIFVTNYNADAGTPGAYVWRSGSAGDTWSKATLAASARHGHAVAIDPSTPTTIYCTVGDAAPERGLYRSTDNGVNWTQLNTDTRYGIDITFAYSLTGAPNRVIMEGDGSAGSPHIMSYLPSLASGLTDAVIYPDTSPADGEGSWAGSARAICLTSDNNLVFSTTGEAGAIGGREGLWIAKGPWFTTPVLLEEWDQGSQPSWGKTYESGDYLYNGRNRITKPKFAGQ